MDGRRGNVVALVVVICSCSCSRSGYFSCRVVLCCGRCTCSCSVVEVEIEGST